MDLMRTNTSPSFTSGIGKARISIFRGSVSTHALIVSIDIHLII